MFADELVRREAFEGLQSSPEVVGADEVGEVLAQLVVIVVMQAFDVQRENDPPDRFLIRLTFLDRAVPLPGSGLPATVRGMRSTWPFVQGCLILVSRWSI